MSKRKMLLLTALSVGTIIQAAPDWAHASSISAFTGGDVVVAVEGNGSNTGNYTDNQAAPLTLYEFAPTSNASSAAFVGSFMLPQTASGNNSPISGEYGSTSEGTLQLSGNGKYLTIMGYGINAATYNANPAQYNMPGNPKIALGQTGSLSSYGANAVPRVVALIGANGSVDTSTAISNVFNGNNPRSAYTVDGKSFYISGQGSSPDHTGGVFYTTLGSNSATPITGDDTSGKTFSQDTRQVQIYNNTLYVSADSKEGSGSNRDFIGTLGTAGTPPTTLANSGNGPTRLPGFGNSGGTGKVTITAATTNGINSPGKEINLSPQNFFFANANTLYVADSGAPKNDSVTNDGAIGSTLGNGGLQKWSLISGSWVLDYTVSAGLGLVANTSASGSTGLYGLTGKVVNIGGVDEVELFATNATIGDTDPTYLYGLMDLLSATTKPGGETFTQLFAAPADSNFKGVAFAPEPDPTPLPATLPLFATGLGALGMLGWRRKRKASAAVAA